MENASLTVGQVANYINRSDRYPINYDKMYGVASIRPETVQRHRDLLEIGLN